MKNLFVIAVFALFAYSCNKLNTKNIRGNWEVEKYLVNNADSTPNVPSYFAFNEGGSAVYFEDYGSSLGSLNFNYSLDEKGQVLTFLDLYGDTSGFVPVAFNVDKKGKRMTLTYSDGNTTLKYELKQTYLNY